MIDRREDQFISYYDLKIKEMWGISYGGSLRALKGNLVETFCNRVIKQAWENLGGQSWEISIERRRYYITDEEGNRYGISQDRQVYVHNQFVLSVECKAYAEVAMYKRIMVDSLLLKNKFPTLRFCLFQLESMLGGDYSKDPAHPRGSPSVKVINYFFPDVNMDIITLLDGERDIKREIHKRQFYKPMRAQRVKYALDYFEGVLSPHI